jgi:hypothetical protein
MNLISFRFHPDLFYFAVHYIEAVLYCDINPFATPKMALIKLSFRIGPNLHKRPWYTLLESFYFSHPSFDLSMLVDNVVERS